MRPEESELEAAICLDCGNEFWPEATGSYPLGMDAAICTECAMRRGGVYDADNDAWPQEPEVRDLEDQLPAP
jgi:hypothetical protein